MGVQEVREERFKNWFRYIYNLLCINNDQSMDNVMTEIYPPELSLTSDEATEP